MKHMNIRKTFLLGLAFLLLLSGCCRIRSNSVTFRVSTVKVQTRTAYSGETDASGYERIDWKDGDWIGIYCAQATRLYGVTSLLADYSILSHETYSSTVSRAQIAPAGDPNGLQWGTGEHKFYAVYPSPNSPELTDAEKAKVSLDASAFVGFIPSEQTVTQKSGTTTWLPQMQYAWMFARTVVSGQQASVELSFAPEFTAMEITVGSGDNDQVDLTSFSLTTSAEGYAVAGEFTIPVENEETESTFSYANTSQSLTIDFTALPGGKLTVEKGTPVTFTVFMLPREQKNLTLSFTGDQIGTKKLALSDRDMNTLVFQGRRKIRITGISLPKLMSATGEDVIWDHEAAGEGIIWSENAAGERIEWNSNGHGGNVNWGEDSEGGDITWD